ncbi:MAG: tRNA preQ1(34) S-adenosylmethionine ribosyltransferase-isomerase QueA [Desulfuromonadales bacterium]|nr:tRNA preQ1(34) S-adenosylmethionine ribosyltransferase-isomerase QueA [Desulfuromonadales bacterium]
MLLTEYNFDLPQELIAQQPLGDRSASRLLLLNRLNRKIAHHHFSSLPGLLREGDLLVRNETRVLPARLLGRKSSGGQVEVLLVRQLDASRNIWRCMTRSSKPVRVGCLLEFPQGICGEVIDAEVDGQRLLRFTCPGDFFELLEQAGHVPLPPYIRREDHDLDKDRYQTVFANNPGAVAAPTAGLHFTEKTFDALAARNIDVCGVTLHVGPGTFLPVRTENLPDHRMHTEFYEVPEETAERINAARADGRRIVALGTTVTRTLEYAVNDQGLLLAGQGETDLFILPGFKFRVVDALITNFHLPKSTLLVLASAFAGRDFILQAYREAVDHGYRFFSYGDCMLIE